MSVLTPKSVVALGDSLTYGFGTTYKLWTTRLSVDPALYPRMVFGNCGFSGDRSDQMKVRYEACVKGRKPDLVILTGFVNNILQLQSAAATWANAKTLVDEIVADGSKVLLVHEGPAGNYKPGTSADWDNAKQIEWLALAASMQAYADNVDIFFADVYAPLGDPANTENLAPDDDSGDGLHWSENGAAKAAVTISPVLQRIFPVPALPPVFVTKADWGTGGVGFRTKKGDTQPSIADVLTQPDGSALNLEGATVRFRMRAPGDPSPKVDAIAVIVDAKNGVVRYDWLAADVDTTDIFDAEWAVTFAGGGTETIPKSGFTKVLVNSSLA